jgi:hypothetical protein
LLCGCDPRLRATSRFWLPTTRKSITFSFIPPPTLVLPTLNTPTLSCPLRTKAFSIHSLPLRAESLLCPLAYLCRSVPTLTLVRHSQRAIRPFANKLRLWLPPTINLLQVFLSLCTVLCLYNPPILLPFPCRRPALNQLHNHLRLRTGLPHPPTTELILRTPTHRTQIRTFK